MTDTSLETTGGLIDTGSEDAQQDPWAQPWSEAGALVLRYQDTDAGRWAFTDDIDSVSDTLDLSLADEGFVSLIKRYTQRRGHLALGFVFELAESWGIEVEGTLALASASDPNLILWPRSSAAYLANLVYLLQHDPETLHAHECQPEEAETACISPSLTQVDASLYNERQPQPEPRWLPTVLCAKREGLGAKVAPHPESSGLASLLNEVLSSAQLDPVAVDEDGTERSKTISLGGKPDSDV